MDTSRNFVVAFPDYPFSRRSNKKATKDDTARFRELVRQSVAHIPRTTELIALTMRFYTPDASWDLDNLQKALLDALKGGLYQDDRQVVELHGFLFRGVVKPRIEVQFEILAGKRLVDYKVQEIRELGVNPQRLQQLVASRSKPKQQE